MQQGLQFKKEVTGSAYIFLRKRTHRPSGKLYLETMALDLLIFCSHRKEKIWQLGLLKKIASHSKHTHINEYTQLFYKEEGQKDEISSVFFMA